MLTVWVEGEGLVRDTVKVNVVTPEFPSAWDTSFTEKAGTGSSFTMVPTPWLSATVAFWAPDRFR